ncbi:hypothetical protein, partial [Neisseria sp. HMSC31F04]|uniref:hypothetical protein n=1 Tax=Neisseria sp. HMSC31F04 TaxID=1581075 RepID=UPI001AEF91FA
DFGGILQRSLPVRKAVILIGAQTGNQAGKHAFTSSRPTLPCLYTAFHSAAIPQNGVAVSASTGRFLLI